MASEVEIFYQAVLARDRRFDGRFFTAVRTTRIYCRPICPARTPLLKNVAFYATAAAAEEAGFRPCQRCRPETAPGTPAWIGTSATVARALKLIRGGYEGDSIATLADRLGVGERRLRQLFAEHIGASPQAVLRVQRLDFARRLIDETTLPMTEVAAAAGFNSIRRFNDAVKTRFGKAPSELRKRRSARSTNDEALTSDGALVLRLPYRPPLPWPALLQWLARRAIPGVELVDNERYARTVQLGPAKGWLEVRPSTSEGSLELRLHLQSETSLGAHLMEAVERIRTQFDLEADPLRIAEQLKKSAPLKKVVAAYPGLRVAGGWDGFELAITAILGQQVSVEGAATLSGRLVRAFGTPIELPNAPPPLTHTFPSAEVLAKNDLSIIGIPKSRAAALQQLAQRVVENKLVLHHAADAAATEAALLEIPGIGPWTAQYIAMRVLRDPDAFPSTDLVLKRFAQTCDVEALRPWRAYAAMYLWKSASLSEKSS